MFLHPPRLAALAGLAGLGASAAQTGNPRPPFPDNDVWFRPLVEDGVCEPDYESSLAIALTANWCMLNYDLGSVHVGGLPRCPDGRDALLTVYRGGRCRDVLRVYNGPGEAPWSAPGCIVEAPDSAHSVAFVCPADGETVKGDEFKHLWDRVFPGDNMNLRPTSTTTPPAPTAVTTSPSGPGGGTTTQVTTTTGPTASGASTTDTATAGLEDQPTTTLDDDAAVATPTASPETSAGQSWVVSDWLLRMTSAIVVGLALMA